MMQYLILTSHLDTFACIDGRVLFCQTSDFTADFDLTINHQTIVKINDELAVIVSDTLGGLLKNSQTAEFITLRQLITACDSETANLLAKAIQLVRFYQDHHFCSRCGTNTKLHPVDNATICPNCHYHQYPRVQPCIITAIIKMEHNQPKILLAHHQRAKASGMYGLIAGFVEVGESLEQCVHREVAEEVGLTVTNLRYIASQPWAFPSNLMVGFVTDYVNGEIKIQEDELIHADFFAFDNLPKIPNKGTIAFELIEKVKNAYSKYLL